MNIVLLALKSTARGIHIGHAKILYKRFFFEKTYYVMIFNSQADRDAAPNHDDTIQTFWLTRVGIILATVLSEDDIHRLQIYHKIKERKNGRMYAKTKGHATEFAKALLFVDKIYREGDAWEIKHLQRIYGLNARNHIKKEVAVDEHC